MGATTENSGVYACLGHSPSEAFHDAAVATVEFYGGMFYPGLPRVHSTIINSQYICGSPCM